jgi:amino-acid N-acetyltransferase
MIRKAHIEEVPRIRRFLASREQHGIIPRPLAYLYGNLRDYFVSQGWESINDGRLDGIAALHICWAGVGEIRSLVVRPELIGNLIGLRLVDACLEEAGKLGLERVFLLTLIPDYFKRFGFKVVTRDDLPPIAWADCVNCIKFPNCDEIPMILEL